jgi:hypothetical protein
MRDGVRMQRSRMIKVLLWLNASRAFRLVCLSVLVTFAFLIAYDSAGTVRAVLEPVVIVLAVAQLVAAIVRRQVRQRADRKDGGASPSP